MFTFGLADHLGHLDAVDHPESQKEQNISDKVLYQTKAVTSYNIF